MLLAMPSPGQAVTLVGLGEYPQTNGACWMPPGSISAPKGGWVKTNDPLALCTYQGPSTSTTTPGTTMPPATSTPLTPWQAYQREPTLANLWSAIPGVVKILGVLAIGFGGYKLYTARKK